MEHEDNEDNKDNNDDDRAVGAGDTYSAGDETR